MRAEILSTGDEVRTGAVVVEDAPGDMLDEVALFHLINMARESKGAVLITSHAFPAQWDIALPDLRSRLKAAANANPAGFVAIQVSDIERAVDWYRTRFKTQVL